MLCIVNKVISANAGAFRYPGALLPGVIEQLPKMYDLRFELGATHMAVLLQCFT
jgi:hypothetical protein